MTKLWLIFSSEKKNDAVECGEGLGVMRSVFQRHMGAGVLRVLAILQQP
jgi:hypothetical protein